MKRKLLKTMFLVAVGLLVGKSAWAYSSQRVYQDWGRGDDAGYSLTWTTLYGRKGLENASETVWDGTSSDDVHTIYNSSVYCPIEAVLPTLTYSDSYSVEFFFKAKATGAFQYAVYKKGVIPTKTMLTSEQVIFSIECTSAASTKSDSDPMSPSINRSATTVNISGQTYYKVVLTVNSTNCTYNIYPINTSGSTPYTVDTSNPVATGTLTTGEMGGLYLNANSKQTMRFDDIMVDFMPNDKTVKTITATKRNDLNAGTTKYYEKYDISATDYDDAAIDASNLSVSTDDASLADADGTVVSFKGLGTSAVTVNNKTQDVTTSTAYLKVASFDFTSSTGMTDAALNWTSDNSVINGFGTAAPARKRLHKGSKAATYIYDGVQFEATFHQYYPDYGINVTATTNATLKTSISNMILCLTYKTNTTGSTASTLDELATLYASISNSYSWAKDSKISMLQRDYDSNGYIYTALDVYVPDGTTVTPTINATYDTSTFSYPYALDLSGLSTMEAWTATTATASAITLTKQTGVVPAGTPLILTGTAEAIPLADISNASSVGTNYLKPVLDNDASKTVAQATDGSTNYVLSVQSEKVVFAPIGATSASVPYGNAYMNVKSVGEARMLTIAFGDEVTGIEDFRTHKFELNENYYDLMGRRVDNPSRGLYIVNGKKVIVK